MTFQEFILLLLSVVTGVAGQFLLKTGALKLGRVTANNFVTHILSIVTTPELIFGLTCYAAGAILYILLLTRVNLSVVGPSVAVVYVFSVLLGYFAFKEVIPPSRLVGLALIVSGVILVVWKK